MIYTMKVKGHSIELHSISESVTLKFDKLVDVFFVLKKLGSASYSNTENIISVVNDCRSELISGVEVFINKIQICRITSAIEIDESPNLFNLHQKAEFLSMLFERGAIA